MLHPTKYQSQQYLCHNKYKQFFCFYRTCRWLAYTQFVYWAYGKLGRGVRKIVPACVMKKIRNTFPAQDGIYTGFKFSAIYTIPES